MSGIADSRLVLAVRNLAASTQFYVDVLGFTLHDVDGAGWSFLSCDAFTVMLGECPDEKLASDLGDHSYIAYLVVEGVDEMHQQMSARGHRVTFGERIRR